MKSSNFEMSGLLDDVEEEYMRMKQQYEYLYERKPDDSSESVEDTEAEYERLKALHNLSNESKDESAEESEDGFLIL